MASDNSESDAHPPGVVWVQSLKQFWDTFANEKLTSLDKRYKSQLRWFQEHPDARSIVETRRRVDPSELVQRPQQQQNDTKVTADDQQEVDHRDDSMEDDLKHDESQPTTDTPPLQVDTNASVTSLSERQPLNPFAALDQPQRSLWPSLYQQRPLVEQFGSLTQPSLQIGQLQRDLLQHGNTAHPEPSTVIKTPTPPPAFSRPSPDLPPAPHVMNEPVSPIHLVEQPSSDPNMQPPQQPSQLPPKPATMHAQNITLPFDDLNKDADDEVLLVPSHGSLEFDDSASQLGNSFLSTSFNGPPSRPHSFIMDDLNDPPSPKRRNTTTRQSQLSATPVSSHNMTSPQSAHARYSQQSVYSRFSPVSTRSHAEHSPVVGPRLSTPVIQRTRGSIPVIQRTRESMPVIQRTRGSGPAPGPSSTDDKNSILASPPQTVKQDDAQREEVTNKTLLRSKTSEVNNHDEGSQAAGPSDTELQHEITKERKRLTSTSPQPDKPPQHIKDGGHLTTGEDLPNNQGEPNGYDQSHDIQEILPSAIPLQTISHILNQEEDVSDQENINDSSASSTTNIPDWAEETTLKALLLDQAEVDGDAIFGKSKPINWADLIPPRSPPKAKSDVS